MSITAVPISIGRSSHRPLQEEGRERPADGQRTRKYASSAPSSSTATARSMDWRSVSAAESLRLRRGSPTPEWEESRSSSSLQANDFRIGLRRLCCRFQVFRKPRLWRVELMGEACMKPARDEISRAGRLITGNQTSRRQPSAPLYCTDRPVNDCLSPDHGSSRQSTFHRREVCYL